MRACCVIAIGCWATCFASEGSRPASDVDCRQFLVLRPDFCLTLFVEEATGSGYKDLATTKEGINEKSKER
jgi:hypothetical protein